MAMIKCPECGKEISDRAEACPHCGCPIDESPLETSEYAKLMVISLIAIFMAVAGFSIMVLTTNVIIPTILFIIAILINRESEAVSTGFLKFISLLAFIVNSLGIAISVFSLLL